jgi:hypothetical protein
VKKLLFFCLICLMSNGVSAQIEDELSINDSLYNSIEESNMNIFGGKGSGLTLSVVSLRKYCTNTSVKPSSIKGYNWATAISQTMTIQYAQMNGFSMNQISEQALSPQFLYELLPKASSRSCKLSRNWILDTKRLLERIGTTTIQNYPLENKIDCNRRINEEQAQQYKRFSVRSFNRIFGVGSSDNEITNSDKIFGIKSCLDRNHPIVLCLIADENFRNLRSDIWRPSNSSGGSIQTVVVVGYDERRRMIEVMGTQGSAWGNNGFTWIRYDDLVMAKYGFEIIMNSRATASQTVVKLKVKTKVKQTTIERTETTSVVVTAPTSQNEPDNNDDDTEKVVLSGKLILNEVDGYENYKPTVLKKNQGGYYTTTKNYQVGSQFQLVAEQAQKGSYVYVFSVDPAGKAEIHFPYDWKPQQAEDFGLGNHPLSPAVPEEKSQVIIPLPRIEVNEDGNATQIPRALTKEVKGTDWLVVLFSDRRLENEINELVTQLSQHNNDFIPHFQGVFGNRLIKNQDLRFNNTFFEANAQKGYIVPMIIKLEAN